jgi:glycosyltransferase involved in cell wall biosynthesis
MLPKACLCLCVYNNEEGLPRVLDNIVAISELFSRLQVIAVYDTSKDASLKLLEDFKEEYGSAYVDIVMKPNAGKSQIRTERISCARNAALDHIRAHYADYPYFIMMDSNEYSCVGEVKPDVLKGVLARDDWDAISFDREAGYYDYWALSYDPFIYSIYHFDSISVHATMRKDFEDLLKKTRTENPDALISVYSAFNGFAVYRSDPFLQCSYSWKIDLTYFPMEILIKQAFLLDSNIRDDLMNDCEHRKFHMEAVRDYNARVRVSVQSLFKKLPSGGGPLRGPA